jgi:hypothetical protein
VLNVFLAHALHVVSPLVSWYRPATQLLQIPGELPKSPSEHFSQDDAPMLSPVKYPVGQTIHSVD